MESMKNDEINKKDDKRYWLLHYVDQTVAITEDNLFVRKNDFNKITGRRITQRTVDLCLAKPNHPVLLSENDIRHLKSNTETMLFESEIFKIKKVDKKPKEYEYVVFNGKTSQSLVDHVGMDKSNREHDLSKAYHSANSRFLLS